MHSVLARPGNQLTHLQIQEHQDSCSFQVRIHTQEGIVIWLRGIENPPIFLGNQGNTLRPRQQQRDSELRPERKRLKEPFGRWNNFADKGLSCVKSLWTQIGGQETWSSVDMPSAGSRHEWREGGELWLPRTAGIDC